MATIRAAWKRVVQVKQYESETLELGVEQNYPEGDEENGLDVAARLVRASAELDRMLAKAGDALILERLQAREGSEPRGVDFAKARRGAKMQDQAPDPKIIETIKKGLVPVEDPDASDDYLGL